MEIWIRLLLFLADESCPSTRCNTLQHAATCCNTLQHVALRSTRGSSCCHSGQMSHFLRHAATRCNTLQHAAIRCNALQHVTLQHAALQYIATHAHADQATPLVGSSVMSFDTPRHAAICCTATCCTATHYNTLHCNALQHKPTRIKQLAAPGQMSRVTAMYIAVQRAAACCNMLQCVAVCCSVSLPRDTYE